MTSKPFLCAFLALSLTPAAFAKHHNKSHDSDGDGLKDTTVLIVRHAEKPDSGDGLAPAGEERARRYVDYFENYTIDGAATKPDALFAAADSKESHRPVLTITPLSHALGLPIDSRFKDAQFADIASELRSRRHGKCILICWHHGEIPQLVQALGADPSQVIPGSKWPGSVFNWVIQLRYDKDGNLTDLKRIEENF